MQFNESSVHCEYGDSASIVSSSEALWYKFIPVTAAELSCRGIHLAIGGIYCNWIEEILVFERRVSFISRCTTWSWDINVWELKIVLKPYLLLDKTIGNQGRIRKCLARRASLWGSRSGHNAWIYQDYSCCTDIGHYWKLYKQQWQIIEVSICKQSHQWGCRREVTSLICNIQTNTLSEGDVFAGTR